MLNYEFGPDRLLKYESAFVAKCEKSGKYSAEVARFATYGPDCGDYWLAKVANNIRFASFLAVATFPSILMAILNTPRWFSYSYLGVFWLVAGVFLLRSIHWSSKIKRKLRTIVRNDHQIDSEAVD
jgi:hypothetical protein